MIADLPITIHIGITGHRPPQLPEEQFDAVRSAIGEVLSEVKRMANECYGEMAEAARVAEEPIPAVPQFRLIGQLAEGADRLAARAAIEAGMEIQAVLPFSREEFEKDFLTEESKAEFRELLSVATAVKELDGSREDEGTAYLNAGLAMLEHIDLLIAVWDGNPGRSKGGTGDIVHRALAQGIPVCVVNPQPPNTIRAEPMQQEWQIAVAKCVKAQLVTVIPNDAKRARRFECENPGWFNANQPWLNSSVISKPN